ncbi:MAG: hypothetical protein WCQ95_11835 [Bacteroidota bacterium]
MLARYEQHLKSLYNVETVCETNDAALLLITEAAAERTNLHNCIHKLEAAKSINQEDITDYVIQKLAAQFDMIESVQKFMLRGAVKASQLSKVRLEASLSKPTTFFTHHDDATIATKAEEVKEILKTNLTTLTNLTLANITEMETKIQTYRDTLALPHQAIDSRKSNGTMIIKEIIDESKIPKNNIIKLFHSYIPTQIHAIDEAARIGKSPGAKRTSIICRFLDADNNVPLINVKCTFSKGPQSITKLSTKKGFARAFSLQVGSWSILAENELYNPQTITSIPVNDDHIERFLFKLVPITDPDPENTTGSYSIIVYDQDTNQPLPGVQISFPSIQYVETTDEDGENYQDTLKPATLAGTLFLEGYKQKNITITIQAAKETTLQVYLEKE